MNFYYTDSQNKPTGPVTLDAIRELVRTGALAGDPMVIQEGASQWRPLSTYAAGAAPTSTPPPAAQGPQGPNQASIAADKAMAASKDALAAFKMFASNPVGGLAGAFENLGPQRAMGAGLAFGAVFALSLLLAGYRMKTFFVGDMPLETGTYFKAILIAVVPFAALVGVLFVIRAIFKNPGGLGHDCFLAGATLLPLAALALVGMILGAGEDGTKITGILGVFALCLSTLILFTGLTQISRIAVRPATFLTPGAVVVAGLATKIFAGILFH